MTTNNRRPKAPPEQSCSAELLEFVVRWLRKKYGDRPLDSHVLWTLGWRLGDVEREYVKDPNAAAIAKVGP